MRSSGGMDPAGLPLKGPGLRQDLTRVDSMVFLYLIPERVTDRSSCGIAFQLIGRPYVGEG